MSTKSKPIDAKTAAATTAVNRFTQPEVPSDHVSLALGGLDLSYDPASRLSGAKSSETTA